MNRDTLYSTAIVDISEGATLTLREVGDRYMAAMIVNQDHYINEVFHGGGTYTLDMDTFDTPYVIVYMRTLVDADDPEDVAAVNAIQDQMKVEAVSSDPFVLPNYDKDAYEALIERLSALLPFAVGSKRTFGTRESVSPVRHLIGTAVGWGGLPETEAMYPSNVPNLPVGEYKIEVPAEVPVGAFWSVSLYDAEGFFEKNDIDGYVINSIMGERNRDGAIIGGGVGLIAGGASGAAKGALVGAGAGSITSKKKGDRTDKYAARGAAAGAGVGLLTGGGISGAAKGALYGGSAGAVAGEYKDKR